VEYPTACIPQAWAAGAPFLGIRTLLGLEPKGEVLTSVENPELPFWAGTLSLEGIPGRWGRTNVIAKGDEKTAATAKQIVETILTMRSTLGEEDLAA
jgi:hypothetical protein